MEAAYLAILSLLSFLVALLMFFLKKNPLLIIFSGATILFSAISLSLLIPMLEESGKAIPGWFFRYPTIPTAYIASFVLGTVAIIIGIYRIRAKKNHSPE